MAAILKYKISFTAWYLNPERVAQLIGMAGMEALYKNTPSMSRVDSPGSEINVQRIRMKQGLEDWMHQNAVPSLGELLVREGPIKPGQLFTLYHDFSGKGLSKYKNIEGELPNDAIAEIHSLLKFYPSKRIRILYSPKNLLSHSAWDRLSGRSRLYCFGYVERCTDSEIIARPYLVGDTHGVLDFEGPDYWDSSEYGEIFPTQIDQFKKLHDIRAEEKTAPKLAELSTISESDIKQALAEILNEGRIPKDWGGERSDLFTTNISIDGEYLSAAFLLKGPAKHSEMKIAHLGKNGDQIDRLFSEPADLLILQHSHYVSPEVRSMMRAYASRIHNLKYFCIIDGADTLRLLNAYGKCGR